MPEEEGDSDLERAMSHDWWAATEFDDQLESEWQRWAAQRADEVILAFRDSRKWGFFDGVQTLEWPYEAKELFLLGRMQRTLEHSPEDLLLMLELEAPSIDHHAADRVAEAIRKLAVGCETLYRADEADGITRISAAIIWPGEGEAEIRASASAGHTEISLKIRRLVSG